MVKKIKRTIIIALVAATLGAFSWGVIYVNSLLTIATGYSAKHLCSAIFISNRVQKDVEELDLNFSIVKYVSNTVNESDSTVTSWLLWKKTTALFRKGVGSTLDRGQISALKFRNSYTSKRNSDYWPVGDRLPDSVVSGVNPVLRAIANRLVYDRAYGGTCFAFLVLHRGVPVVEAYGKGITANTRLLGWSMAKSFSNAIVGTLVLNRKADIYRPVGFSEWQHDDRKLISPNDLMRMQSGLKWNEEYGNTSDVTKMLYCSSSASDYAVAKPFQFPAGSHWEYSSGSTNLLCRWAGGFFRSNEEFYRYMYSSLFNRIGLDDVVVEPDGKGLFIGSSYIYATARDYARFALLYLQDGVFEGERILPSGWAGYSTTPTTGSKGEYGAGFWLNAAPQKNGLPSDMYSSEGHDGQRIYIIPSKQLAVVVLGYSPRDTNEMRFTDLLTDILMIVK